MSKFDSLWEDYQEALERFEEILKVDKSEIVRDSAIKRFEMVFDLAWKTSRAFIEERHNAICVSPQSCFREAYRLGLIDYDNSWIKMSEMRNKTVHTYDVALAEEVYAQLPETLVLFKKLASFFKDKKI